MCEQLDGQVSLCDLGIWSGKMSLEPCQAESPKGQTSKQSLKKSSKSSAKKLPLFLSLKAGGLKPVASAEWVTAAAPFPSLGDFTMPSFGEYPSEENASRLSQILEDSAPQKYSLSARACAGILNRASRRGKALPPELKAALERQCMSTQTESDGDEECDPQS